MDSLREEYLDIINKPTYEGVCKLNYMRIRFVHNDMNSDFVQKYVSGKYLTNINDVYDELRLRRFDDKWLLADNLSDSSIEDWRNKPMFREEVRKILTRIKKR